MYVWLWIWVCIIASTVASAKRELDLKIALTISNQKIAEVRKCLKVGHCNVGSGRNHVSERVVIFERKVGLEIKERGRYYKKIKHQ